MEHMCWGLYVMTSINDIIARADIVYGKHCWNSTFTESPVSAKNHFSGDVTRKQYRLL